MAQAGYIDGDLTVNGTVYGKGFAPGPSPLALITDALISATAAIATTKMRHRSIITLPFNANSGATAAAVIVPAHAVYGATGSIVAYGVGSVAIAVGAATVVLDLLKNGSSILTGTITLDSANTARVIEAAPGFTSTNLVVGDLLEAKIVSATAGGGTIPVGAFFRLVVDEDPA